MQPTEENIIVVRSLRLGKINLRKQDYTFSWPVTNQRTANLAHILQWSDSNGGIDQTVEMRYNNGLVETYAPQDRSVPLALNELLQMHLTMPYATLTYRPDKSLGVSSMEFAANAYFGQPFAELVHATHRDSNGTTLVAIRKELLKLLGSLYEHVDAMPLGYDSSLGLASITSPFP